MEEFIQSRFNYWIYVILMMIGLWGMIAKNNLIKKLIGMSVFQTAIILFYVSVAVKSENSSIPILPHHGHDYSPRAAAAHAAHGRAPLAKILKIITKMNIRIGALIMVMAKMTPNTPITGQKSPKQITMLIPCHMFLC